MSAEIDRFLATGDAAKKKKTAPATIRRVGLRCTNCGGSHHTVSCPYEKKQGGLHNEDGTKIRVCSIYHKPGHTKRNYPELDWAAAHGVAPVVVTGERRRRGAEGRPRESRTRRARCGPYRRSSGDEGFQHCT